MEDDQHRHPGLAVEEASRAGDAPVCRAVSQTAALSGDDPAARDGRETPTCWRANELAGADGLWMRHRFITRPDHDRDLVEEVHGDSHEE